MSKENAKLFYEELAKNEALQEKFKVIGKKYEGQTSDEVQMDLIYQNEILPIAKESGFEFTLAEFKEYKQEVTQPQSGKLSDDELDNVAGGQGGNVPFDIGKLIQVPFKIKNKEGPVISYSLEPLDFIT